MLAVMALLIPRWGMPGAAAGRLIYGPITWITYVALYKLVWSNPSAPKPQIDTVPAFENV